MFVSSCFAFTESGAFTLRWVIGMLNLWYHIQSHAINMIGKWLLIKDRSYKDQGFSWASRGFKITLLNKKLVTWISWGLEDFMSFLSLTLNVCPACLLFGGEKTYPDLCLPFAWGICLSCIAFSESRAFPLHQVIGMPDLWELYSKSCS